MAQAEGRVRFGPRADSLAPVLLLAFGTVPVAFSAPALRWLLLVPVLCAVWVLRARVVVDRSGVEVCNGLGVRRVPWEQVEGFDVPRRGPVRLLTAGRRVALTALPRARARDLVEASRTAGGA